MSLQGHLCEHVYFLTAPWLTYCASVLIDGLMFIKLFHIDKSEKFLLTFNMKVDYLSL